MLGETQAELFSETYRCGEERCWSDNSELLVDPIKGLLHQEVEGPEDTHVIPLVPATHAPFFCVCSGCHANSF